MTKFKIIFLSLLGAALFFVPLYGLAAIGTRDVPSPLQPLGPQVSPNVSQSIDHVETDPAVSIVDESGQPVNFIPGGEATSPAEVPAEVIPQTEAAPGQPPTRHFSWLIILIIAIVVVVGYILYRTSRISFIKPRQ